MHKLQQLLYDYQQLAMARNMMDNTMLSDRKMETALEEMARRQKRNIRYIVCGCSLTVICLVTSFVDEDDDDDVAFGFCCLLKRDRRF